MDIEGSDVGEVEVAPAQKIDQNETEESFPFVQARTGEQHDRSRLGGVAAHGGPVKAEGLGKAELVKLMHGFEVGGRCVAEMNLGHGECF